ncbi:uncharacterized protein C3orf62 homolog [Callorhinchus milii]|uniref:uncharacterized protein C3orf62 homolog n=1 Tax=Callorhinchus milii TaxID=7868 RepID=UPI001C3FC5D4|nr:uncharacterized protein C3orf62 homolog [Callorhinchus milii]
MGILHEQSYLGSAGRILQQLWTEPLRTTLLPLCSLQILSGLNQSPRQETNINACLEAQGNCSSSNSCEELTKNLLEIIESTSIRTLEALAAKLEPLNESSLSPDQSPAAEDTLALFFADPPYSPIKKETHIGKYRVSEDDNLINIVLDMEEDYNLVKKS